MSWTHSICAACWNQRNPGRPATAGDVGARERCCWCRRVHASGIYLREDPARVPACAHTEPAPPSSGGQRADKLPTRADYGACAMADAAARWVRGDRAVELAGNVAQVLDMTEGIRRERGLELGGLATEERYVGLVLMALERRRHEVRLEVRLELADEHVLPTARAMVHAWFASGIAIASGIIPGAA